MGAERPTPRSGVFTMSLIAYVTKIHFAENVLEDALEAELALLGLTRPLVICDHGAARGDVLERLLAAMPSGAEPIVYRNNAGIASEEACMAAAALYAQSEADGLIGFGGTAAMHLAKAVALRVSHAGPLGLYAGGGARRIRDLMPASIAIPTLASSCAEATGVAALLMRDGTGIALASPFLVPRVVICDPTLTLDLPPEQTAGDGMDALTHCLETFFATAYNPPADGIARDGARRAVAHLERAVCDGSDLHARREMMAAALNGALASQKGLGGVHAMSHALAGLDRGAFDHGALNAVLLPVVLDFNAPAVAGRYDEIKRELGLSASVDLAEMIVDLRERVALPASLREIGICKSDLERAAVLAEADYCNRTNPRHADAGDYLSMLRAAL